MSTLNKDMRIQTPPCDLILLAGDHHGQYGLLKKQIEDANLTNTLIIHVGDGSEGLCWFNQIYIENLNDWFKKRNCHYWSIRGNHSDPAFFQGNWMLSNLKLLPDNSRATLNNKEWLFIGGATSIDQIENIPNITWWEGEAFNKPKNPGKCDVLITHTGPSWVQLEGKGNLVAHYEKKEIEQIGKSNLWERLQTETKAIDQLFLETQPKQWFLGHFHTHMYSNQNNCKTTVVAANELIEYRK